MPEYTVLLPGDESAWETATEEDFARVMGQHERFSTLLAERGHTIVSGAELAPSGTARVLRSQAGEVTVTDGPYAEAAEQLGGFYLVRTDDLDDLAEICKVLIEDGGAVEIRPTVDHGEIGEAGEAAAG